MSDASQEIAQLRSAVVALTKLTHELLRKMIEAGIAEPHPTRTMVGGLQPLVLDQHLRAIWNEEIEYTAKTKPPEQTF